MSQSVFDQAEDKLKNPNPFDQAEKQYKSPGPRKYSPESEKRGKHSMTGRESRPRSAGEQALDLAEGTGKVMAIGTAPVALAFDPAATLAGVAGGAAAGYGGKKIAEAAGAGPQTSRAIGDVAGLVGGGAAAKFGPRMASSLTPEFISKRISGLGEYLSGIKERWNSFGKASVAPETVSPKPEPKPPEPYRPNPNIVRKMKYGGANSPEPSRPGRSVGMTGPKSKPDGRSEAAIQRASGKLPTPKTGVDAAAQLRDELGGSGEVDPKTGVKTIPAKEDPRAADRAKLSPKGTKSLPEPKTGANASAPADRSKMLGEALKATGFTPEQAQSLKPEDWHAIAQQVGIETPDQATVDAAIKSLK